jgi:hypothetical protein
MPFERHKADIDKLMQPTGSSPVVIGYARVLGLSRRHRRLRNTRSGRPATAVPGPEFHRLEHAGSSWHTIIEKWCARSAMNTSLPHDYLRPPGTRYWCLALVHGG